MERQARVPCESRVEKRRPGKRGGWTDQPCGALSEPGVEHCAVHLTDAEKRFLQHRREEITRWQNTEHPFQASEGDPTLCCLCQLDERVHIERKNREAAVKDATYGG